MLIVPALNVASNFRGFHSSTKEGDNLYPTKSLTLSLRALRLHNYPFFKSDSVSLAHSSFYFITYCKFLAFISAYFFKL